MARRGVASVKDMRCRKPTWFHRPGVVAVEARSIDGNPTFQSIIDHKSSNNISSFRPRFVGLPSVGSIISPTADGIADISAACCESVETIDGWSWRAACSTLDSALSFKKQILAIICSIAALVLRTGSRVPNCRSSCRPVWTLSRQSDGKPLLCTAARPRTKHALSR